MPRKKAGLGMHGHACACCGDRYEDACSQEIQGPKGGLSYGPGPDDLCTPCRSGQPVPFWPEARLPKDCCLVHSRPVRTQRFGKYQTEAEQYALAGDKVWFICDDRAGGCSRTFPYDPSKPREERHGKPECRARPAA